MKNKLTFAALALLALLAPTFRCTAFSLVGTAFTYQGQLTDNSGPANGSYDLIFTVYDSTNLPGSLIAGPLTNSATSVTNGLFTVSLDFGLNTFDLAERWLEIGVRTNGGAAFATLAPRQRLAPTPYAIAALNAGALLGSLPASQVTGALSLAQLPVIVVTNNESGVTLSGSFSGIGASLANVNALTLGGVDSNGFWRITGNAGTTPGPNFIGTTDNQPLEFQVNGVRGLRIEPNGAGAPNLIGGYFQNSAGSYHAVVIAGGGTSASLNQAAGDYAFIGSGHGAQAGSFSAIVDGGYNISPGQFSFIGSGLRITNLSDFSFIGTGSNNLIQANSPGSFIGGGFNHLIQSGAFCTTISGGNGNVGGFYAATISGGESNNATSYYATVGGGSDNTAAYTATVGGGTENSAIGGSACTVGGGTENTADGTGATVAGGIGNQAILHYAAIGGGAFNTASGQSAVVGGGGWDGIAFAGNQASGNTSVVGGGHGNTASGNYATVPGGAANLAAGRYSFAAGQQAQALHQGSFVWADSQNLAFASTTNDQFLVRAVGGVGINKNNPASTLDIAGTSHTQGANNWDVTGTEGDFRVGTDSYRFKLGVAIAGGGAGDVWMRAHGGTGRIFIKTPGGTTIYSNEGQTSGVTLAAGGGAWSNLSDRNSKENFTVVDAQEILERVASLPLATWNYKSQEKTVRHIGPMAQDFASAFQVGEDERHITTIDAEGVALAAIKGLNEKVETSSQKLEERLEQKETEITELKQRLEALEKIIREQKSH